MKKIIISLATLLSINVMANSTAGLSGVYKQQSKITLKSAKKVKTINATSTLLIDKQDDNSARVKLNIIGNQASTCALDEEFLRNGDTLVFTKNSQTGRGTCEITIANFRDRGALVYENKDSGECVDFCSKNAKIGVRLFDKSK